MQTEPGKHTNHRTWAWLLAFAVPFLIAAIFGAWLGYGEFTEDIGKNFSAFGKVPGPLDVLQATSATSLMIGIPAGLVGVACFAIYCFLGRVSSATKP